MADKDEIVGVYSPVTRIVEHEHEDGTRGVEAVIPAGPQIPITASQAEELKERGVRTIDEVCGEDCDRKSSGGGWNSKNNAFREGYDGINWKN